MAARLVHWIVSGIFPAAMGGVVLFLALTTLDARVGRIEFFTVLMTAVFSGVFAMALLETIKRVLPLRAAFQRRQLRGFVRENLDAGTHDRPPHRDVGELVVPDAYEVSEALEVSLMSERGPRWVGIDSTFNLPAEQFVAQLGRVVGSSSTPKGGPSELLRAFATMPGATRTRDERVGEVLDVSGVLDRLQIRLGARWRHYLSGSAMWMAGALALAWAVIADHDSSWPVIAALVFGGFFAWLARDVAGAVESWRR